MRILLKSKIHRATITEADLNYEGSITIDSALMESADIIAGEKVLVVNATNGHRFETYVLEGTPDSGVICVNGAAARLVQRGDMLTILSFEMSDKPVKAKKVLVDQNNKFVRFTA
jgi:aspartate 1-decarboxylase